MELRARRLQSAQGDAYNLSDFGGARAALDEVDDLTDPFGRKPSASLVLRVVSWLRGFHP